MAAEYPTATTREECVAALMGAVRLQERAYAALEQANREIQSCERNTSTYAEILQCVETDRPLKRLLHATNASALCLSGGGIRSASFCLGVLEGLARFSRNKALLRGGVSPVMDDLDYLSTVSGGGYIGSWMMSWTYRRMAAARLAEGAKALDMTTECIERAQGLCLRLLESLEWAPPVVKAAEVAAAKAFARRTAAMRDAMRQALENAQAAVDRMQQGAAIAARDAEALEAPAAAELREKFKDLDAAARAGAIAASCARMVGSATDAAGVAKYRALLEAAKAATNAIQYAERLPHALEAVESLQSATIVLRPGETPAAQTMQPELNRINGLLGAALDCVKRASATDWRQAYGEVIDALAGISSVTSGDPEPNPVRHLRSYSSFLAPELGATLDTATLGSIVFRNLVVNWLMLVPILFCVISGLRASAYTWEVVHRHLHTGPVLAGVISVVLVFAGLAAALGLPSHRAVGMGVTVKPAGRWLAWFGRYPVRAFVIPVFAGCWLLAATWHANGQVMHWSEYLFPWMIRPLRHVLSAQMRSSLSTLPIALGGYLLLSGSFFVAYLRRTKGLLLGRWHGRPVVIALMALTSLAAAVVASGLLGLVEGTMIHTLARHKTYVTESVWMNGHWQLHGHLQFDNRLLIIFAVPLVTLVLIVSSSLFCALLGGYEMEEDREWWMRCGGCLLSLDAMWIVGHGLVLYGQGTGKMLVGLGGLAVGALGSWIGYSSATSAGTRTLKVSQLSGVGRFLSKHNLVMPAVSIVAVLLIAIGMVALEEAGRQRLPGGFGHGSRAGLESALWMFLISAALTLVFNLGININLFSLQGMYRMRLMRAFLGASNTLRRPDNFTNFDPSDTPHQCDLPKAAGAPLHVINTTLNLVGTKVSAWRQRRAESFTFSAIHAGGWRLGYVPAMLYGGGRGVTLATSMAISGAAFNPNMGYQSSALTALLMTFFNLRLGYWLPNPKRPTSGWAGAATDADFFTKSGPSFALYPLIEEALGLTDDSSRWVELTDGGHFENLGLYEMVLRRVKRIIVVDAGADPKCQFEDLGNAIRKIQIDLGIPIEFENDRMRMKAGVHAKNSYCAVAKISYHCVDTVPDDMSNETFDGELIYIKAGLTGREPADVLQYAKTHPTFPHESTADQFFNESQFESYRHLGSFVLKCVEERAVAGDGPEGYGVLKEAAMRVWGAVGGEGEKKGEPDASPSVDVGDAEEMEPIAG